MAFAQINILHDGISMSFILPSDDEAMKVIRDAFGDEPEYDGITFAFKPGMSRKQVLVPKIDEVLEKYN